jgi:hypothetical protein
MPDDCCMEGAWRPLVQAAEVCASSMSLTHCFSWQKGG